MSATRNNTNATLYIFSRLFRNKKPYKNSSQLFIDWANDRDSTGKQNITEREPVVAVAVALRPQAAARRTQ